MSVVKRIKTRRFFMLHFALLLSALLLITWVDIQLIGRRLIVRDKGGEILGLHPYHFWIMTVSYIFTVSTISLTYAVYTRDYVGTAALFFTGLIFAVFSIEDILYYRLEGRRLDPEWPWLWQSRTSGTALNAEQVVMWCNAGLLLIGLLVLTYFVYGKKIRKISTR